MITAQESESYVAAIEASKACGIHAVSRPASQPGEPVPTTPASRPADSGEPMRAVRPRVGEFERQTLRECVICFDSCVDGASSQSCTHFVCKTCLTPYVTYELDVAQGSDKRLEGRRNDGGNLQCPRRTDGCSGYLSDTDLQCMLPDSTFQRYCAAKRADEEHRRWQEEHRHDTDPAVLREGLLREMPNAKQCGNQSCGFGPIECYACPDLELHHGERPWQMLGNGQWVRCQQIRNECPKCGWWARDSSMWPAWDGSLPG